jgi:predicted 3-demethylubiquinone-9 3-methyltransferase (glyoxalase superfamily)
MFVGSVHGQARAAMTAWTLLFPTGHIVAAEEYTAQEGPVGTLKHARFAVSGQGFVAMDSHAPHKFAFNEGVSMQVMCQSQAELDRYWDALCDGGTPSQCGWLKDRFGISWQVVPQQIAAWLTDDNVAVRERVFQAIMSMTKFDIAALEAAARG